MERINETIKLIPEAKRDDSLSHIDSFLLNPSHDFNAIAVEYYNDLPLSIRLLLRSAGVTRIQGYFTGRPMDAKAAEALLIKEAPAVGEVG